MLYSIQRGQFQLLWIDVCKVRHYVDSLHANRYHHRIVTMVEAACRKDIPVVMAGHHRPSWNRSELHEIIERTGLIQSEHACCAMDICLTDRELSNVKVTVCSRPGFPHTP